MTIKELIRTPDSIAGSVDCQRLASGTVWKNMINGHKINESSAFGNYVQGFSKRGRYSSQQHSSIKRKATNYEDVSRRKQRISYLNGGTSSFQFPNYGSDALGGQQLSLESNQTARSSDVYSNSRTTTSPSYMPTNELSERGARFSPTAQYKRSPLKPKRKYCPRASSNSGPLMQKAMKLGKDIKRNIYPHVKQKHHHVSPVENTRAECEDVAINKLKKPETSTGVKNLEAPRNRLSRSSLTNKIQNNPAPEKLEKAGNSKKVASKPMAGNMLPSNRKITTVQNKQTKRIVEKNKTETGLTPIDINKRQQDILLNYKIPKKKSEPVKEKIDSPPQNNTWWKWERKPASRTVNDRRVQERKLQPRERQTSLTSRDSDDSEDDWSITNKREVAVRKGKASKSTKFKRIRIESDDEDTAADHSPEISSIAPLIETVPVSAVITCARDDISSDSLQSDSLEKDLAPEEPDLETFDSEIFTQDDDDDDAMTDPNEDINPFPCVRDNKDNSSDNSIHSSSNNTSTTNSITSSILDKSSSQVNINLNGISETATSVDTRISSVNENMAEELPPDVNLSESVCDDVTFIDSNVLAGSENMTSFDNEMPSRSEELSEGVLFTAGEQCRPTDSTADSDDEVVFIKEVTKDEKILSIVIDDDEGVGSSESAAQFPCIAEVTTLAPISCDSSVPVQNLAASNSCEIICEDDLHERTPVCSVSLTPVIQQSVVPARQSVCNSSSNNISPTPIVSANQHVRPKVTVSYTGFEDLTKDLLRCTSSVPSTSGPNTFVKPNQAVYCTEYSNAQNSMHVPSSMLANALLHSKSSPAVSSSDIASGAIASSAYSRDNLVTVPAENSSLPSGFNMNHLGIASNLASTSNHRTYQMQEPSPNALLHSRSSPAALSSNTVFGAIANSVPAGNSNLPSGSTTSHPGTMSNLGPTAMQSTVQRQEPGANALFHSRSIPAASSSNAVFGAQANSVCAVNSNLPQTSLHSTCERQEPSTTGNAVSLEDALTMLFTHSNDPTAYDTYLRISDLHAQKNQMTRDSAASNSITPSSGTMSRTSNPENSFIQPVPNQAPDRCVVCKRHQASFCSKCGNRCCYNNFCIKEHSKTCKPA